jgi:hypothetical protein
MACSALHPIGRCGLYGHRGPLVYVTILRPLWAPQGAQWLADVLLHYGMPLGYLGFWLFLVRKTSLRWYDPLLWLI